MPIPGQHLPNHPPSTHIAKRGRELGRMLDQLSRVSNPRGLMWSPVGPLMTPNGTILRAGITGGSGIPALAGASMTGTDVTEVVFLPNVGDPYNFTLSTTTTTFIGFNLSAQAVAATTYTMYVYLWGMWICIFESCPA